MATKFNFDNTYQVLNFGNGVTAPIVVTRSTRSLAAESYQHLASDRWPSETVVLLVNGSPVKAVGKRADAIMERARRVAA